MEIRLSKHFINRTKERTNDERLIKKFKTRYKIAKKGKDKNIKICKRDNNAYALINKTTIFIFEKKEGIIILVTFYYDYTRALHKNNVSYYTLKLNLEKNGIEKIITSR